MLCILLINTIMYSIRYILILIISIFLIWDTVNALELWSKPLKNTQEQLVQKLVQEIEGKWVTYTSEAIAKLERSKIKKNSKKSDLYYRILYLLKNNSLEIKKNSLIFSSTIKPRRPQLKSNLQKRWSAVNNLNSIKLGSIVTLNYTLHIDSETWPVQETTIETIARENGRHMTGALYQPFTVAIWQNQIIYGFEQWLIWLKKWQKKSIKVIPSEGYWRAVVVPRDMIAPEYTLVSDKKLFDNTTRQTIKKTDFSGDMLLKIAQAKVGDTIIGNQNQPAKVEAIDDEYITLLIENIMTPFYWKSLVLGATDYNIDNDLKITAIDAMNVTLNVTNKKSPFYWKVFAVGESVTPPNGNKITIKEFNKDTVTIVTDHPFMNRMLYFDVEILDIQ